MIFSDLVRSTLEKGQQAADEKWLAVARMHRDEAEKFLLVVDDQQRDEFAAMSQQLSTVISKLESEAPKPASVH